jgi:predicted MFS family arabinose efflux permease
MQEDNRKSNRFTGKQIGLIVLLFSASFVVGTGIQMGNALFPGLSRLMDVPLEQITLLTSAWAFTGLLSPLFGPLSDRYGHGIFVLIGIGTFMLGSLLSSIAPAFAVLMAFQIVVGFGYAIFSFSGSALIGDVFHYDTRAKAMGIVRFSVAASCLAGVPAAAALAGWGTARASYAVVGALALLVLGTFLALLPRVRTKMEAAEPVKKTPSTLRDALEVIRDPQAIKGLLIVLFWAVIPTGAFIYLAAWLQEGFQLGEAQIGLAFSLVGVGSLMGNTLTAAIADRIGKKRSTLIGLVSLSLILILMPRSPNLVMAMVALVAFVIALDFGFTSFGTLLTEMAPENRGTLMSLVALANGIGTGLTPIVLAPVWETGGYALITVILGFVGLASALFFGLLVSERVAVPAA